LQEEVENRAVNLAISTSKLTARAVITAVRVYLNRRKGLSGGKDAAAQGGRQTVKQLIGAGEGVSSIDIAATDLRGFERVARKYGIGYAVRKDPSAVPPNYLVFFRARDKDAMTAAFTEYAKKTLQRDDRPSVLEQLRSIAAAIRPVPGRAVGREKKREIIR